MRTLGEATNFLLQCDTPADWLELADVYMQQYNKNPDRFILPREHAVLLPLIEAYALDFTRWIRFVRALRDELFEAEGRAGARYRAVHVMFRTLEVRYVQQERRERIRQAVAWLEVQYPSLTADQKKLWVKRLEQLWMKQRRAWLNGHRQGNKHLTLEDQRRVLDEFWADVDDNIKQGNLPKYE